MYLFALIGGQTADCIPSVEVNNQVLRSKMNYGILSRRFYTAPVTSLDLIKFYAAVMFGQGARGGRGGRGG